MNGRIFSAIRIVLRLGWLVPLVWMFSPNLNGNIDSYLSIYILIGFALTVTLMLPEITNAVARFHLLPPLVTMSLLIGIAAAAGLGVISLLPDVHLSIATLGADWLLLIVASFVALTAQGETGYSDVVRDLRFGMVAIVFVTAFSYTILGSRHVHVGASTYVGVIAYLLIGMVALAVARRFLSQDDSVDDRESTPELDWVFATGILVFCLLVVSLILAQLFVFDIVGSLGALLAGPASAVVNLLRDGVVAIATVVVWLIHFLPLHKGHGPHYSGPKVPKPHQRPSVRPHSHRPGQPPAWADTLLKSAGLFFGGLVGIALLIAALRLTSRFQPHTLRGEQRTSQWSWRGMFAWLFRRSRAQVARLRPHGVTLVPRRRKLATVRDVYSAYLDLGANRARRRRADETGWEYSQDFAARWTQAEPPLEELNNLYADERYGRVAATTERVSRAREALLTIKASSEPSESQG